MWFGQAAFLVPIDLMGGGFACGLGDLADRCDGRAGGQSVDRRLWTAHHGVVLVNVLHVL